MANTPRYRGRLIQYSRINNTGCIIGLTGEMKNKAIFMDSSSFEYSETPFPTIETGDYLEFFVREIEQYRFYNYRAVDARCITPTEKKNETKFYKKNKISLIFLSQWHNRTPKGFTLFHDYNFLRL